MTRRWLAYLLFGSVSFAFACKGGGDDVGGGAFLEVVETTPERGREDVQVEARIAVRVSEAIDAATLTSETFFLTDESGAVVPSTVAVLDDPNADPSQRGTVAELEPDEPLAVLTSFTVTLTAGLTSTRGTHLEENYDWTFKTLDAAWGESEWIEPLGAWSSSEQEIALDGQLNAIAVWKLEDEAGTDIYANRYTRTDLWGEPEPIGEGTGDVAKPKLAMDGVGNGFAVWERQADDSERNIWANRYDVDDATWGTPALLQNGDLSRARIPAVAADPAGNATAIWVQANLDTPRQIVRAIRYEPSTGWGDAVTIGSPTTVIAAGRTAVGMDDQGHAIAVWDPPAGPAGQGGRVLWANRYTPGSDWGEPEPIKSDETTSANDFRLDVGVNGDAFAIWIQDNGNDAEPRDDIWGARFSEGAWSAPERIDRHDDGGKTAPDVAVDGAGIAYAVWSQADSDFDNIWAAQYDPVSESWGAPELIEPPTEDPADDADATVPRVDTNRAGNVFVVWVQRWDQQPSIWSNRRDPGTSWMSAERIEAIPGAGNQPTIAVDEARHAHALWLHSNSGTSKVRTNRFE